MTKISENEFARICEQIYLDRDQIYEFNPNVAHEEVLLWMLLACLINYLNLSDAETPCFPGAPGAEIYRQAIHHVLQKRLITPFEIDEHLNKLKVN